MVFVEAVCPRCGSKDATCYEVSWSPVTVTELSRYNCENCGCRYVMRTVYSPVSSKITPSEF